jgi:hypothetical protein
MMDVVVHFYLYSVTAVVVLSKHNLMPCLKSPLLKVLNNVLILAGHKQLQTVIKDACKDSTQA